MLLIECVHDIESFYFVLIQLNFLSSQHFEYNALIIYFYHLEV